MEVDVTFTFVLKITHDSKINLGGGEEDPWVAICREGPLGASLEMLLGTRGTFLKKSSCGSAPLRALRLHLGGAWCSHRRGAPTSTRPPGEKRTADSAPKLL